MSPLAPFLLGVVLAVILMIVGMRATSFRSQKPADLAGRGPAFDLRRHLSGPILCEGVIYGPTGKVSSCFVADMEGSWEGNIGTLQEVFHYDSGRVQDRYWKLTLGNDGTLRAEAPDVVGTGQGVIEGPAVCLRYRIKLDDEAGGHVLDVVDWMYLMENGTIMNRSQFSKFGITVAELVATMRPVERRAAA